MDCIIPGLNAKVLAKAINALSKIGDELFIEAKQEKLTFLTFNQSKTVCGKLQLLESFFSVYHIKDDSVTCKIHMKTLLPMFKGTQLEKKLEYIKFEYENEKDFMVFKVKYKTDDIVMSHTLCLMDPEVISMDDYSGPRQNSICAQSDFFNNLLTLFSNSDDDITFEVFGNKLVVRNYNAGAPHKPKSVRSQVNLNSSEFALYRIGENTTVNFPLKAFRTAIAFSESFNLNMGLDFDKGGSPMSISIKNPTFHMVFLVATMNPFSDGLSTVASTSLPAKVSQLNNSENLALLANDDWDKSNTETSKVQEGATSPGPQPDSPRAKRVRYIFKRSFEDTFHPSMLASVLVENSDSD